MARSCTTNINQDGTANASQGADRVARIVPWTQSARSADFKGGCGRGGDGILGIVDKPLVKGGGIVGGYAVGGFDGDSPSFGEQLGEGGGHPWANPAVQRVPCATATDKSHGQGMKEW